MKRNLCLGLQFVIELPKVNNVKTEDLTPEQLDTLLRVLDEGKEIHAATMVKLALYTGMRRGELFRLRWQWSSPQKAVSYTHLTLPTILLV